MTKGLTPPSWERFAEKANQRITDLEKRLRRVEEGIGEPPAVWYMDELEVKEWGGWVATTERRISAVICVLLNPDPDDPTTFHLNVNGTSQGSVTYGATQAGIRVITISKVIAPKQDILTGEITEYGGDATGLTAFAVFAS